MNKNIRAAFGVSAFAQSQHRVTKPAGKGGGKAFRSPKRNAGGGGTLPFYEDYLLASHATNLRAYLPLAWDDRDLHTTANHAFTRSGLYFSAPMPRGFRYRQCTYFDGVAGQIRLENTSYPFGLLRWTIACWFRKQGAGVATSTAGAGDGFPAGDPVVPLVTKGRGEAEGSNVDCNWFFGLNKVSNGSTYKLAGDFEQTEATAGTNNRIVGASTIVDNQWYFGVFTFDGANLKLYLNGVLDATVACIKTPRSDSIQKAGIGTAYTSGSVAGGFFNGYIGGVSIWSEAKSADDILALYNRGNLTLRAEKSITVDAPDNELTHGTNFANWSQDALGSTKDSTGVTVIANANNYAEITLSNLGQNTEYWCRIDIAAKSGGVSTGQLRVAAIGSARSPGIAGTDAGEVLLGNALVATEPKYFKVKTANVAGPYKLVIYHSGSANGETIKFSDLRVFGTPARSAAKIVHLGDATGGFDNTRWNTVADAILHANADALNILSTGDRGDTTNSYETCNDRLKLGPAGNNGILSRGGSFNVIPGNHDFDASLETVFHTYWGSTNYNAGKFYWQRVLGSVGVLGFSNWTDDTDGFYYNQTPQVAQISVQGRAMLELLCKSTADWNIAMIHWASYSSSGAFGGGNTYGRLLWAELGVPLILQAHYHGVERLEEQRTVEGSVKKTCFYTVARGGGDHHGWTTKRTGPVDFTRYRLESSTVSGYLKLWDSPATLVVEYYDTSHNLLDRIKFTQVAI